VKEPSPPAHTEAAHQRDGHNDERHAAQEIGANVDEASDAARPRHNPTNDIKAAMAAPEMMRSKIATPARNVGKYPRTPSATCDARIVPRLLEEERPV
jgi:hypothetical protein